MVDWQMERSAMARAPDLLRFSTGFPEACHLLRRIGESNGFMNFFYDSPIRRQIHESAKLTFSAKKFKLQKSLDNYTLST